MKKRKYGCDCGRSFSTGAGRGIHWLKCGQRPANWKPQGREDWTPGDDQLWSVFATPTVLDDIGPSAPRGTPKKTCQYCGLSYADGKQWHLETCPLAPTGPKEGVKHDAKKPRTDLLPFDALLGVSAVLDYGERKYAARNWELGMDWGRMLGAGLRHVFAWANGENVDVESGLHHLDHAATCFLMLSALVKRKKGKDDRAVPPKPGVSDGP